MKLNATLYVWIQVPKKSNITCDTNFPINFVTQFRGTSKGISQINAITRMIKFWFRIKKHYN